MGGFNISRISWIHFVHSLFQLLNQIDVSNVSLKISNVLVGTECGGSSFFQLCVVSHSCIATAITSSAFEVSIVRGILGI